MAVIKGRDTKPEIIIRKALHQAGFRYRLHVRDLPGKPDMAFGCITIAGEKFFWKISYYDARMEYGSDDPANPEMTTRVLTIMRADEY